jgi:hypothetical protein
MSEFTNNKAKRIEKLLKISQLIIFKGDTHTFIKNNEEFIDQVIPSDFIVLFDETIKLGYPIEELKALTNKLLNVFHKTISSYNNPPAPAHSFIGILEENNRQMEQILKNIRPVLKAFVKGEETEINKEKLKVLLAELELFDAQYTIKENILFPVLEKQWPNYRCLQIMWSFHDDIRKNIKNAILLLNNNHLDMKKFNRYIGDIFFNMLAIKFREEYILFPEIMMTITEKQLNSMKAEALEMAFPYTQPLPDEMLAEEENLLSSDVDLGTGNLNAAQIKLIFNHLPVDITYVDENDIVRYFSTPKKRIFPRTKAIIGREVSNCHPPESVHIVEKIVDSFKSGEKDEAKFWIQMRGEFILIQYFAVRNEQGEYKGVIEVSQEVSDIRALEGEKRLLDW